MIRRSTRAGMLALAALVLVGAACGGGSSSSTSRSSTHHTTDPFGGRGATEIAALAAVNATRERSVSLRVLGRVSGYLYEADTVASDTKGVGRFTLGGAPMTIRLINDTAYVRGTAAALERMWHYPPATARRYAHVQLVERNARTNWRSWIEPLDHGLWSTYDVELSGTEHRTGIRTVGGQRALGISGKALDNRTPETIYVSTAAPHLPVEVVIGTGAQKQVVMITGWNKPVVLPPASVGGLPA